MKKAKKLLAVLLAVVMLASAACVPVYAKIYPESYYTMPDKYTNNRTYYFSAEKGCAYILDMVDEMLEKEYIMIDWDSLLSGGGTIASLADFPDPIDIRSIDNLVNTLYDFIDAVDSGLIGAIADIDALAGDLTKEENLQLGPLNKSIDRGTRSVKYEDGYSDLRILYMLVGWLNANTWLLQQIVAGTMTYGALESMITGIEISGIPLLEDLDEGVKRLLYNLLIDSTTTTVPAGMTIEDMVQQLIDWALIEGTGESAENGGFSMLGMNHEALMPTVADYPGAASITGVAIQVDRDGNGVMEQDTMDVYQFVNNLINGLLNGILAPELGGMIADLVGVEITEQYPNGDPALLTDVLFSTILGAVEGLLVQNGADPVVYTEAEGQETPMGKINDLVNWLFNGCNGGKPALYTFINIDYYGIGLTDNFMSLLNDLIRLAINLLPVLGIELPANSGLPTSDELAETYWYKLDESGNMVYCEETDEAVVDQLFMTYEGERVCYATYTDDTKKTVDYYTYLDDGMPVNTSDATASDYENADFIRPYYKISMDSVWAALVKMIFSMFVEGPYFPEWTTDMASVLAYGCAGLAVSILPEENFYKRLDAYYLNGYSATDYYYEGETVATKPIAYSNVTARSAASLPTGAMSILSSVGAYFLNSMLDLTEAEKFTTHDTSFEQLLTELALWGFIEYIPILAGEVNTSTGLVYETTWTDGNGNSHPAGTYAVYTNDLIEAVYSSEDTDTTDPYLLSRVEKSDANFDAIYTYLDQTLLSLIPASWLPDEFNSSQAIFNDWLFGNLMEFDLQGILSIFSANPEGELGLPLLTVLLRVIDRVLAIVLGGNAVMQPTDRSGIGSNSVFAVPTSITTLTALIEDGDGADGDTTTPATASLPTFIGRLLTLLNTYKAPLFETFLPLLISSSFERIYNFNALNENTFKNTLGDDMTVYKIADLEDHIEYLTSNINADFSATYATEEEAEAAVENLENAYIETVEVTPATDTTEAVYEYNVYVSRDFKSSATKVETTADNGDIYSTYTNFNYKSINASSTSNPLVTWDDGAYYFWSIEDNNPYSYYYSNFNSAVEEAETFVDSYYGFVENDLSDAFGEWLTYSIQQYMVQANLYDPNDDGRCVTSETDTDYVAPTTDADGNVTDPGYPVDGYPSPPESMYPYLSSSSDTNSVTWIDPDIDDYISQTRNSFNDDNYELLAYANEFGNDPENYVEMSLWDTEDVVRYALGTIEFDITANADGTYDGQYQWEDLQDAQLASIANTCSAYYMYFEYDVANGVYKIYRKGFAFITDNFYLGTVDGTNTLSASPVTSRPYVYDPDDNTAAQQTIYDGYTTYCENLYSMRRSLYNQIAQLDWRMEEAESMRKTSIDVTMLNWALDHVEHAYITESGFRNKVVDDIVDGVTTYTKVYTQKSYDAFREARDYAKSLATEGAKQAAGVTQSMVTEAFQHLLETYNALILYTGPADWVQFLEVLAQAKELADPEGVRNDPELGYVEETILALDAVIADADLLYANENVMDCENQDEIDTMVTRLETAIIQLEYLQAAKLIVNTVTGGDTQVIETSTGNRTLGHIIGLVEGQGITMDLVEETNMVINVSSGNEVTILESSKGLGTGAYYKGTVGGLEKFRYYAVLYGDLNGDARIDGTDWSKLRYTVITGSNETASGMGGDYIFEAADVDHDGDVDADDATLIRDYYNYAADITQVSHSTTVVDA